ncbi:MAG: flavodoxin [Candidatus Lokiarchaeota archaeon]|nr:flavodoxin [Candidatus Lokiarchaeota archaeon]MBD3199021.1 flavodoxin [Candidatus Lokiarchaeota archaeon]
MCLIIVKSIHHKNTEKIAKVFARILDARIKVPKEVNPIELQQHTLIGFGSGIYSGKHHNSILELVDNLPEAENHEVFIFSTDGAPRLFLKYDSSFMNDQIKKNHEILKEKLISKGYSVVAEFNCGGWNTNKFLKLFGGINKGRPNADDLKKAEEFAISLHKKLIKN